MHEIKQMGSAAEVTRREFVLAAASATSMAALGTFSGRASAALSPWRPSPIQTMRCSPSSRQTHWDSTTASITKATSTT